MMKKILDLDILFELCSFSCRGFHIQPAMVSGQNGRRLLREVAWPQPLFAVRQPALCLAAHSKQMPIQSHHFIAVLCFLSRFICWRCNCHALGWNSGPVLRVVVGLLCLR